MGRLTINSAKKNNETSVSNVFLDKYMSGANGDCIKVYLYLLRCMNEVSCDFSLSGIADFLNFTERDVIRALKYWDGLNVISVEFDKESGEPSSIVLMDLNEADLKVSQSHEETAASAVDADAVSEPHKAQYAPAIISQFKKREEVSQLIFIVEQYIGRTLNNSEAATIIFLLDELCFSPELVEYLVEYCVNNNHKSLRYIETVGRSWHSKGIKSVDQAKEDSAIRSKKVLSVAKAFGINDRVLTASEMNFVTRWYDEYGFDVPLISEACNRTILATGKPNFNYAEGILKKWREAKIHTLADLEHLDAGFRAKYSVPIKVTVPPAKKPNGFNSFPQRQYDFSDIEKKLLNKK